MAEIRIERYSPAMKTLWDDFVTNSKNGTFLLKRGYMDYHSDRFTDHSFIFLRNGNPFALLPAAGIGDSLISHPGLTYGGLVTGKKATAEEVLEMFRILADTMPRHGFSKLVYKAIPHIYHRLPAEEDLYALFRLGATLEARGVSSTIQQSDPIKFRSIRKAGIRKAAKEGISIAETRDFAPFWEILDTNLQTRYGVSAVHTLEEILLLASRFPDEIRLHVARKGEETLAGVVMYLTATTAHSQYIAASPRGKECGALDMLIDNLVNNVYKHLRHFDFGISTEHGGSYLNTSLIYQKEGFGGRATCYDTYILNLAGRAQAETATPK